MKIVHMLNLYLTISIRVSLRAQLVRNLSAMQETPVWFLGREDPLEKEKSTHSSFLAQRIPWTLYSMGSQRVGHDWGTLTHSLKSRKSLRWVVISQGWRQTSLQLEKSETMFNWNLYLNAFFLYVCGCCLDWLAGLPTEMCGSVLGDENSLWGFFLSFFFSLWF